MSSPFPRWLDYEGYDNFRDLGGYSTKDGRRVRWQRLYRTGAFVGAAAAPPIIPAQLLKIGTVVDLRTGEEIGTGDQSSGFDGMGKLVHLPLQNPELDAIRSAGSGGMGDLYLSDFESKAKAFAAVLSVLAEEESYSVVVRCRGGKDRTGIVIALILDLLGILDETIVEEYVLTDTRLSRIPRDVYEETVKRFEAMDLDPEILRTHPQTMSRFLEGLRERWGTAEDIARGEGVGDEVIAAVRSNLLE